jgi:hypothetical protein
VSGDVLTGVSGKFTAEHRSPEGDIHEHTWAVLAWFACPARCDARCQRAALDTILASWDGTLLPDELAWGEDIARTVGTLVNCVEVVVTRDDERIHARWVA